jgi:hypothetical protein
MSALTTLKLSTAKKSQAMTPTVHRRLKLSKKLWEQIELAKATSTGGTYTVRRFKTIRDDEGNSRSVELPKKVRQWWWIAADGKLAMNIRYGAKVIELAKGKSAIEMATMDDLVPTLELIKRAVEAGELDGQIEAASIKLREGFGK